MGAPNVGAALQNGLMTYLKANEARYAPQTSEATLKHLLKPYPLTGPAREAQSLQELLEMYGEDSDVYKTANRAFNQNLNNAGTLNDLRNMYIQTADKRYATNLGKTYYEREQLQQDHEPWDIGNNSELGGDSQIPPLNSQPQLPLSNNQQQNLQQRFGNNPENLIIPKEKTEQLEGYGRKITNLTTDKTAREQAQANEGRELLANSVSQPYVGVGSSFSLGHDILMYSLTKDKKLKESLGNKLITAAVADRLTSEVAVQQLKSQRIPATVDAIRSQKKAYTQGWADQLERVVNNLPPELQKKVKVEHDRLLAEISQKTQEFAKQGKIISSGNVGNTNTFESKEEALKHLATLSPEQLRALKATRGK